MKKGCITLVCTICMCALMVSADVNVSCGENVTCSLNEQTLTVSGTGRMKDVQGSQWGTDRGSIINIVVKEGVTSIGTFAFSWLTNLTSVEMADTVTAIGDRAFFNCRALKNVTFSKNILYIGHYAFAQCSSLSNVVLPDTVTTIGNATFFESGLISVTIPASVTSIGNVAFGVCRSLTSISVEEGNTAFKSINGVLYNYNCTTLMQYPSGNSAGSFVIPDGVEVIEGHAFRENMHIALVIIPESVHLIQIRAFQACFYLVSVFYQGVNCTTDAEEQFGVLRGCGNLRNICVSPGFTSDLFCQERVTNTSTCQEFQKLFDICNKGSFSFAEDKVVPQRWKNVTEWEEKTDECVKYSCDANIGLYSRSICNSTEDSPLICVEGKCITGWVSGSASINVAVRLMLISLVAIINYAF